MPFGPETYKIRTNNAWSGNAAKYAISEAMKHCAPLNKHFMPVEGRGGSAWYSILDENDPELKRPAKGVKKIPKKTAH